MPRQNPVDLPDVVKAAVRVAAVLNQAVSRFPRRHRFAVGARLCEAAEEIALNLRQAWKHPGRRIHFTQAASDQLDRLHIRMQIAKDVEAFASFAQFEDLARIVDSLGRQCGGWLKELRQGQSAPGAARPQRTQTLSARAASQGAQP